MDNSVIEEIAKQLGMAVDQAGQFITEHLPEFAAMKAMYAAVPLVIAGVMLLIAVGVTSVALRSIVKNVKAEKARYESDKAESQDRGIRIYECNYKMNVKDYDSVYVVMFGGIGILFVLFVSIFASLVLVPELIGWLNYPDAMLINMALEAV